MLGTDNDWQLLQPLGHHGRQPMASRVCVGKLEVLRVRCTTYIFFNVKCFQLKMQNNCFNFFITFMLLCIYVCMPQMYEYESKKPHIVMDINKAGKMTQRVKKSLADKPVKLSWVSRVHIEVERNKGLHRDVLWPSPSNHIMYTHVQLHLHTRTSCTHLE